MTQSVRFETWRPALLPAVVRFWNKSFSSKRNFAPMTPELLRRRVTRDRAFDSEGFILARKGRGLAGVIHVGRRRLGGFAQGYVALLCVDPRRRGEGIGNALWHRGLETLRGTRQVVILNAWENPFYGSRGGGTPFWGTPWGIGVEWGDSRTLKFLARKGYAPQSRAVQLALELAAERPVDGSGGGAAPALRTLRRGSLWQTGALRDGSWRGVLSYYAMDRAGAGLFGVYGLTHLDWARPSGRALARRILAAAVDRIRSQGGRACEVLTCPDLRREEHQIFLEAGFAPVTSWAVY